MNKCNYEFYFGSRKGESCMKNCRGVRCGKHSDKTRLKRCEETSKRDEAYYVKAREYIKKKRSDPAFKAREHAYGLTRVGIPYETDPYYKYLMSVNLFQTRGDEYIPINHKRIKDAWGSDRWLFNDICKKIDNIINGVTEENEDEDEE
jgi:hypothetical protein